MALLSDLHYCVIISGPTASGKTGLSLQLAKKIEDDIGIKAQVINADVGQFYKPLSIGTAKPDWQHMPVKHHLFDVLDEPKDLDVVAYRKMVLEVAEKVWGQGDLPIIVGGSIFYIRSLFFPPIEVEEKSSLTTEADMSWERLYKIDPERAKAIHPSDTYRIQRAIAVWEKTGIKPSEQEPQFNPPFHTRIIFIDLDREILYQRINQRTEQMVLQEGWIDEAEQLKNSPWESFLKVKKLIGYPEIFDWLDNGGKKSQIPDLIDLIQQKTRHYAKRQLTFGKKFCNILKGLDSNASGDIPRYIPLRKASGDTRDERLDGALCETETLTNVDNKEIRGIIEHIAQDLDHITREKGKR